jgi:hypothetical protein
MSINSTNNDKVKEELDNVVNKSEEIIKDKIEDIKNQIYKTPIKHKVKDIQKEITVVDFHHGII